jgi:predicted metal-binding protein
VGIDFNDLLKYASEAGAAHSAMADVSKIRFVEEFRKACEKNMCRKYDTNWMGPPALGPINELMERARKYRNGLLFQSVHQISSSFDLKGMMEGGRNHEKVFRALLEKIKSKYDFKEMLPLNAGCCSICPKCAYLDNEPCRHPDQAVSSVEAYGIDVMRMEKDSGIPYYNGKNTVSFVGLILFNEDE